MKTIFVFDPSILGKNNKEKKIIKFADFLWSFNKNTYFLKWLILVQNGGYENGDLHILLNKLGNNKEFINLDEEIKITHERTICFGNCELITSFLEKKGILLKKKTRRGIPYSIAIVN